jgi:hypothetical protein
MSKLGGGLMIGAGILIAGVSGLCSSLILWDSFSRDPQAGGEYLDFSTAVPILGGIPFLIGLALIWGGRRMLDRANAKAEAERQPRP